MADTRILVVEDEIIVARDLKNILEAMGYVVTGMVASGGEAVRRVAETRPDLVLMDIMLGGSMDGIEAADAILAQYNVPVIYLTAYADSATLQRAKITEPYGYLLKPFAERELEVAIEMGLYKHRMRNRLRESEQWFAATLKSIADGVIATNTEGKVKFMNPVAEYLTGWKEEDAIGKNVSEVLNISILNLHEGISRATDEGDSRYFESRMILIARNGKEKYIDFSIAPIEEEDGEYTGGVLAIRDITRRVQVEDELRRHRDHLEEMVRDRTAELTYTNDMLRLEVSEKEKAREELKQAKDRAESANRAKTEFLANMSHELRTPLNSIIGFSKLMKMQTTNDDFKIYLDNMLSSGLHLLNIINDILDLSKIEAGKMDYEKRPLNIRTIVFSCVSIMAVQAKEKKINLDVAWSISHDIMVCGEEKRLQQIFINIISNAIKFTAENGHVMVRPRLWNGLIEVDVIDDGIGIKKEHLGYIFEKFSQVGSGLGRGNSGTGLGLTITKRLVEAHNGKIRVESSEGVGSTVTVALPVSAVQ